MSQPLRLVETSPNLPARADVVVIGGGIIGVFTAYYLARRGLSVVVVEKGRIGAEQSSRNWGWCRQQNRDARELPMSTRSLELWDQFAADSGEDTGFQRCGLLYLSNEGFNYLTGTRVTSVSCKLDKVYVSRVVTPDYISGGPRSVSLTEQRGDLYLTVALDLDNNQAIDNGEYEFVKLDFPG